MRLLEAALATGSAAVLFAVGAFLSYEYGGNLDALTTTLTAIAVLLFGLLGIMLVVGAMRLDAIRTTFNFIIQFPVEYLLAFLGLVLISASLGLYLKVLSQENYMDLVKSLILIVSGGAIGYVVRDMKEGAKT
jgi:hypothetical protein